jgi:DNA invertase Pin-like site-specific DNA recombinase
MRRGTEEAASTGQPNSATQPQASEAATRPRAYSYIRFSTPEQAKGDSLRRQTERAHAYAETHGLELDTELRLEDLGVSAFRSVHAKTGALSGFLKAVKDGLVPAGSYLLIENIDRLTRDDIMEATELFLSIIRAGIVVVTLTNGFSYSKESLKSDPYAMFQIVMELIRANQESVRKSDLLSQAYLRKRRDAAQRIENGKPFTRMLPAWLTYDPEARSIVAILERANVIQSIFKMADEGLGQHAIAQRLNAEGEPTFGGLGKQRKANAWHRSYVKKLLTNSAVVGTFTPHQRRTDIQGSRKRVPLDPVENYFPAIIERDLFERVASRARATAPRGRNAAAEPKSIFAGLLRCAHCGGTVTRMSKGEGNVYLICSRANRRLGCKYQAVRYEDAERALLENATAIMQDAPRGRQTEDIDAEIANLDAVEATLDGDARFLVDELILDKNDSSVRARLREKRKELQATRERLRQLRAHRDTLASPYVARRLQTLEQALTRKPLNVVEANKALKEAVSRIVINPESAELTLHWHHAPDQPTEAGPFASRHMTTFDVVPGGYVYRAKRGKGSKEG